MVAAAAPETADEQIPAAESVGKGQDLEVTNLAISAETAATDMVNVTKIGEISANNVANNSES